MKNKNIIHFDALAAIILIVSVCAGCSSKGASTDKKQKYVLPDSIAKTLKLDVVSSAPITNDITLTGKVDYNEDRVSRIYPMVSGMIQDVKVQLGDYVHAGQVLGVIRSSEMAGYSNDLVSARTNLSVARKNLDATKDMYNSGMESQKDLLSAKASYAQAVSELRRANQILKINGGSTHGNYIVRSPVNGFVVEKLVNNNTDIRTDNGTNLFTIADLKFVWIMANVYESSISFVHLGDKVQVTTLAYPDRVFSGKVDKIMNVLDPVNKVMKVRIVLRNPKYKLKPEMFANVKVKDNGRKCALCVNSNAVVFDQNQNYVLVYKSPSDIRIVHVNVISTVGNKTFVTGALQEGENVIASQAILIYDSLNE